MSLADTLTMLVMALAIAATIFGHFYASEVSVAAGLMIVAPTDELKFIAMAFMFGIIIADRITFGMSVKHILEDEYEIMEDKQMEDLLKKLKKDIDRINKESQDDEEK